MAGIVCPSCGSLFSVGEMDFDGEVSCPSCSARLHVVINGGELESVELVEEGFEEEVWLEDEDLWETEEGEEAPGIGEEWGYPEGEWEEE